MKISKHTRIFWISTALVLLLGTAIYQIAPDGLLRCYFVRWSDLDEIAPNIYVDQVMPESQRETLLASITNAKERIAALYGEYTASPVIITGHTMAVMEMYGGNSYNRAGRAYLTLTSAFIILGPNGISDVDILSHELAHIEFSKRIGHLNWKKVPNWFDEGLAIQFDDRYTEEEWQRQTNNGEKAPNVWHMGVIRHDDRLGYATAKHEVSRWLGVVKQEGFWEFLDAMQEGNEFDKVYRYLENQFQQ